MQARQPNSIRINMHLNQIMNTSLHLILIDSHANCLFQWLSSPEFQLMRVDFQDDFNGSHCRNISFKFA